MVRRGTSRAFQLFALFKPFDLIYPSWKRRCDDTRHICANINGKLCCENISHIYIVSINIILSTISQKYYTQ